MKKLLVLTLALALLLSSASAEDDPIAGLSLDQLLAVNSAIQLKIFSQEAAVDGVRVPAGTYVVGVDLPAGVYRVEYRPLTETSFCSFTAVNEKDVWSFFTILGFDSSSEIGKIDLTDGTEITISGGEVYFYTYTGLFH